MKQTISIDFDEVIASSSKLKQLAAKQLYNINIPYYLLKSDNIKKSKIPITLPQYREIQKKVYRTTLGLQMQPIPQALNAIENLRTKTNYNLQIVTSRGKEPIELKIAQQWSEQFEPLKNLPWIGVGNYPCRNKKQACKNSLAMIEDSPKVLTTLIGTVPELILLSRPENQNLETEPPIKKYNSWKEISNYLLEL